MCGRIIPQRLFGMSGFDLCRNLRNSCDLHEDEIEENATLMAAKVLWLFQIYEKGTEEEKKLAFTQYTDVVPPCSSLKEHCDLYNYRIRRTKILTILPHRKIGALKDRRQSLVS